MAELCGATALVIRPEDCIYVGPCILPEGHRGDHREAGLKGNTWGNDAD